MCFRSDFVAQGLVHRDLEDVGALQVASLEEPPAFQELLNGYPPDTKGFRQVTVAETSLAWHTARNNDRTAGLGKKTTPEPTTRNG